MSTKFPHSFHSKKDLLVWANQLLKIELTKIEQFATGSVYCQILDILYNNTVPLQKIKWKTKKTDDFVKNFMVLQKFFQEKHINKTIQIDKLVKAKPQDNLEFAQWMKSFFDKNIKKEQIRDYNPTQRRNNVVPDFSFCGHGVPPKHTLIFRNGDAPNKKTIIDIDEDLISTGSTQSCKENKQLNSNKNVLKNQQQQNQLVSKTSTNKFATQSQKNSIISRNINMVQNNTSSIQFGRNQKVTPQRPTSQVFGKPTPNNQMFNKTTPNNQMFSKATPKLQSNNQQVLKNGTNFFNNQNLQKAKSQLISKPSSCKFFGDSSSNFGTSSENLKESLDQIQKKVKLNNGNQAFSGFSSSSNDNKNKNTISENNSNISSGSNTLNFQQANNFFGSNNNSIQKSSSNLQNSTNNKILNSNNSKQNIQDQSEKSCKFFSSNNFNKNENQNINNMPITPKSSNGSTNFFKKSITEINNMDDDSSNNNLKNNNDIEQNSKETVIVNKVIQPEQNVEQKQKIQEEIKNSPQQKQIVQQLFKSNNKISEFNVQQKSDEQQQQIEQENDQVLKKENSNIQQENLNNFDEKIQNIPQNCQELVQEKEQSQIKNQSNISNQSQNISNVTTNIDKIEQEINTQNQQTANNEVDLQQQQLLQQQQDQDLHNEIVIEQLDVIYEILGQNKTQDANKFKDPLELLQQIKLILQ